MKVLQLIAAAGVLPYLLIRHRIQTVSNQRLCGNNLNSIERLLGKGQWLPGI